MNTTTAAEFDYQAYINEHKPDLSEIHRGPQARQKRRRAAVHNERGLACYERADYDRAVKAFTKAIDLRPGFAAAYRNRGLAYRSMGEIDLVIADFSKVINLKPDDPEGYNNRAAAYCEANEYDLTIEDCHKAIALVSRLCRRLLYSGRRIPEHRRG